MSRSTRSRLITVLYFVLLIGILVLPSTVIAQGNNPPTPPGLGGGLPPGHGGPNPMTFQPPANANAMGDFRPEQANEISLESPPGQQVVANLQANEDNFVRLADDKVGIFIEEETVAPAAELRFTLQDVETGANPENPDARPGRQTLMRFEVELHDRGNGNPLTDWQIQTRIVVDLRQLVSQADLANGNLYLAYQDEADPSLWHQLDVNVH